MRVLFGAPLEPKTGHLTHESACWLLVASTAAAVRHEPHVPLIHSVFTLESDMGFSQHGSRSDLPRDGQPLRCGMHLDN